MTIQVQQRNPRTDEYQLHLRNLGTAFIFQPKRRSREFDGSATQRLSSIRRIGKIDRVYADAD